MDDESHYRVDILSDPPPATSDTGSDLRALQMRLERRGREGRSRHLFDVLDTGPIPPKDVTKYVDVYERGLDEIASFLRG